MIAYKLYYCDKSGQYQFVSLLPERRKNVARITRQSVMEWGKLLVSGLTDVNDLYFIQVEL
jgi:hypothetical protein